MFTDYVIFQIKKEPGKKPAVTRHTRRKDSGKVSTKDTTHPMQHKRPLLKVGVEEVSSAMFILHLQGQC